MADLGELVVRVKADASQLEREMRRAQGAVQQGAGQMGGALGALRLQFAALIPALSVGAFAAFARGAADVAGHMQDLADRIGFSAGTLSGLEKSLATSGSGLDEFAAAVSRMNNMIGEAAKGNQEAVRAFDGMGLSVTRLRGMSPEDQFDEVVQALARIADQSRMTEAGMNIFGRSFASLIPMIKETNGHLRDLKDELGPDTIKRIDDFGDHMQSSAIDARNAFLGLLGAVLRVADAVPGPEELGERAGNWARDALGLEDPPPVPEGGMMGIYKRGAERGYLKGGRLVPTVGEATRVTGYAFDAGGNLVKAPAAGGSNADLLKAPKAGKTAAAEQAQDYDALSGTLDDYLRKQEMELDLVRQGKTERAGLRAVYEAQNLAVREGTLLTEDEIRQIDERGEAIERMKGSMQEASRFSKELHDGLAKGLADIATSADSAAGSMANFARQIANTLVQKKIAGPLSDALVGKDGGDGLLDGALSWLGGQLPGFAEGGSPAVGAPSIVGERGPEIFVPKVAGTVIPNGALGGSRVSVVNNWNIAGGVTRQELAGMMPMIEARSRASVFSAIERGGREASLVGRKG